MSNSNYKKITKTHKTIRTGERERKKISVPNRGTRTLKENMNKKNTQKHGNTTGMNKTKRRKLPGYRFSLWAKWCIS